MLRIVIIAFNIIMALVTCGSVVREDDFSNKVFFVGLTLLFIENCILIWR